MLLSNNQSCIVIQSKGVWLPEFARNPAYIILLLFKMQNTLRHGNIYNKSDIDLRAQVHKWIQAYVHQIYWLKWSYLPKCSSQSSCKVSTGVC